MAPRSFDSHSLLRLGAGFVLLPVLAFVPAAFASGFYRDGAGARAISMAGADAAWAVDPIGAMASNPAGLGWMKESTFEFSLTGARASGEFENKVNDHGRIHSPYGVVPDAGLAFPIGSSGFVMGIAVIPDALMNANWRYDDPPGGLDGATRYRQTKHRAQIQVIRSAFGVGYQVGPKLSLGASLGLLYNRNLLQAPYVFQSQPALRGAKTLLDLDTSGWGINGTFGFVYKPVETLRLGLAYTLPSRVSADGSATGDASGQLQSLGGAFALARGDFGYDATVINHFPQSLSGGVSWQAFPRLRLAVQLEWIEWSEAFDSLEIRLSNGNNAALNGLVGASSAEDFVPLLWRDRLVFRAGVEWTVATHLQVRAGYAYGKSPVPEETLTPLTAAILEHTVGCGLGFESGRWLYNVGYQYDLPVSRSVETSLLRSGEYGNSRVSAGIHWLGISVSIKLSKGTRS